MLPTLLWLALAPASAQEPPRAPCGTLAALPSATPLRRSLGPTTVTTGEKQTREAYGGLTAHTSDNFAVWVGSANPFDDATINALLDAFEHSWDVQIGELGHPAPSTTETFRFNVYISNTGPNTPDAYGSAGYYWTDFEGYPLIVIGRDSMSDDEYAASTAAHEFYHAVQGSLDRYGYEQEAAWFWEATAEWATIKTYPDNPYNSGFVFAYLGMPHLPLYAFQPPETGAIEDYYQYGAFVFPYDLSLQYDDTIVRDAWTHPGSEPDPIEVMRGLVADRGDDFNEVWLDHLARNATYDYPLGEVFREITSSYLDYYYSDVSQEIAVTLTADGSGRLEGTFAPRRYGSATLLYEGPALGELTVTVTADETGPRGTVPRFGARVSVVSGASIRTYDVPFDGLTGQLAGVPTTRTDLVYLTVGAWTDVPTTNINERFPFDWSMTTQPPPQEPADVDEPDAARACGCVNAGAPFGNWALFATFTLLGLARRDRRH